MSTSVSVTLGPRDKRCQYWAKIIRAAQPLPPHDTDSAGIPGPWLRRGEEELFPGDVLLEAEARHHRKARGWDHTIAWVDSDGAFHRVAPSPEHKAALKSQGLAPHLLTGSGPVTACLRIAHGLRAGLDPQTAS